MVKFSIIIPVYNAENYLERSVGGVLSQQSQEFELILVDDGSIDESAKICDDYASKDQRVIVCHKPNGGASSARNKGIELSRGEWIIFVDADDEVMPNLAEVISESVRNQKADVIFFGFRMIFPTRIINNKLKNRYLTNSGLSYVFTDCEIFTPWSKALRRDILQLNNIRFDLELKNGEDTLFMFQYLRHINSVITIDAILYVHYVIEGSLSAAIVPYNLNKDLLNQISKLTKVFNNKFDLSDAAKNKLEEIESICIGRIINMNIRSNGFYANKKILESLDINLYLKYLHPITLSGKIYKFLLSKRYYKIIDLIQRLK